MYLTWLLATLQQYEARLLYSNDSVVVMTSINSSMRLLHENKLRAMICRNSEVKQDQQRLPPGINLN
jgi:hypothetical protein